jgi:hypothetical protein
VPDLRYWRYKEIYLPATKDMRRSPKLIMDGTTVGEPTREEKILLRGDRQGKKSETTYTNWNVYRPLAEHLIQHALARVGMKRLPCFAFSRRSFTGHLEGLKVVITLDAVSDCPKAMQGSYLHLSPFGWLKYSLDDLRRASVGLLGSAAASELSCDYFELLKEQYPKFPWTWQKS